MSESLQRAPRTVREEARDTAVFAEADVLVAGGGMAGCAAALAAARAGAETILLERNGCLGGVATATLMANIGNRYMVADGTQVVRGIAGEIVDRLVERKAASPNWRRHGGICMDSECLKIVWLELLHEAGVTVLTHSLAAMPVMEGNAVRGCFFESKSGRLAVLAGNTVDATGEADIAWRAGAEVREHRASSSLLFKLSGVDVDRFVDFLAQDPDGFPAGMDRVKDFDQFARRWREDAVLFFPHHGGKKWRWLQELIGRVGYGEVRADGRLWWDDVENIEAFGMYMHGRNGAVVINTGYLCFDHVDVGTLSRYETLAQRFCGYAADFMVRHIPGFEHARIEHIGVDLGLRGGRHIIGRSRLRKADLVGSRCNVYCDDVIATTPGQPVDEGEMVGAGGMTCDVPFGSCVPNGVSRLLVGSGKSVDAEGGNSRIYRGMSGCMVYGQAAGAAAALASGRGVAAGELPVRQLQGELYRQGVRLGDERRLRDLGLL